MDVSRDAKKSLKEIVLTRVVRLNAKIYGVVAGVITALAIFVATHWLVPKGERCIDVVGLTFGSYSWQRRAGHGYEMSAFVLD